MLEGCPCKLSVADVLKSCKDESREIRTLKLTTRHGLTKVLRINYAWVQGRIATVYEKADKVSLALRDETGTIRVSYNGSGEIPWISAGMYCSAVGKVTEDGAVPGIEAVKMTNLSRNPVFEKMWPLEVQELKLVLLGVTEPKLVACKDEEW